MLLHWLSHWGSRGDRVPPWQRKICQKSGKRGRKSGETGKRGEIEETSGRVCFVLYVNDIINTSTILNFVLFADDTTILYSHWILSTKSEWLIMNWKKLRIGSKQINFQLMLIRPILWLWVHHKKHSNSRTI